MNSMSLSSPVESVASGIYGLWQRLPLSASQAVLVLLPADSLALTAVTGATVWGAWPLVHMPVDATPQGVASAIAQFRPGVVVCVPEIFGWVSKQAFLGHCQAIYTCGESGEGTLLDRARHCVAPSASAAPWPQTLPAGIALNTAGHVIESPES